jgi:hypothetical protein
MACPAFGMLGDDEHDPGRRGVFAGTNVDDLIVLTVLFLGARAARRPGWTIWLGQYAASPRCRRRPALTATNLAGRARAASTRASAAAARWSPRRWRTLGHPGGGARLRLYRPFAVEVWTALTCPRFGLPRARPMALPLSRHQHRSAGVIECRILPTCGRLVGAIHQDSAVGARNLGGESRLADKRLRGVRYSLTLWTQIHAVDTPNR